MIKAFEPSLGSSTLKLETLSVVLPGGIQHSRQESAVQEQTELWARYETLGDSFEVYTTRSLGEAAPSASDVSEDAARTVYLSVVERLYASGLVAKARVDTSNTVTRRITCAEGNEKGLIRSWVDEYLFFVPVTIDGIALDAKEREIGVSVNVHKSGSVRRIEIVGAAIASGDDGTVVRSVESVQRAVTLEAAAESQVGPSRIESRGVRYILDEFAGGGEVTPRETVVAFARQTGPAGESYFSKGFTVSSAVDDASGRISVSPTPGDLGPEPWQNPPKAP